MVAIARSVAAMEAAVTLEISGRAWAPAPSTVQSALEAVKGVSGVLKVENLIKAVTNAHGMNSYHAKFKKG